VATVRVAFDSRPGAGTRSDGGCYARCLLDALRTTAGERNDVVETHRPRGAEVFHAPWVEGAMLHSPCPMVVTIHDIGMITRRSERLRCGGVHLRLRHLALQRATHVIVPSEEAARTAAAELGLERIVVIPQARGPQWTWEDAAHATWRVYGEALAQQAHPRVGGLSRRRAARTRRGWSSAGL
jgi:hypothetical protein